MNAERRKLLTKAIELINEAKDLIAQAAEGEQEAYDNMPESFQMGDKGDKAQEIVSNLEMLDSDLESPIDTINEAVEA